MFVTKVVLARANGGNTPVVITTDAANCVRVHKLVNNFSSGMSWSFYAIVGLALLFVFRLLYILYNDTVASEETPIDPNKVLEDMFAGKTAEEIMADDPYAHLEKEPLEATTNSPEILTDSPIPSS